MGTATYTVGPSDFFTPGDLQGDADLLNSQVTGLDNALNGNEAAPQDWFDGWTAFQASWLKFYSSTFGGFLTDVMAALNDGNRDTLISFENQFATWATQATSYGAGLPGPTIAPSTGSGDSIAKQLAPLEGLLPSGTTLVIIVLVLIALVVAWKVKL